MNDDELQDEELDNDTHVEDSRDDPLMEDEEADEGLVDKLQGIVGVDDKEDDEEEEI